MRGIYECMTLIITGGLLHSLQFPMNNYFKRATICWAPINIAGTTWNISQELAHFILMGTLGITLSCMPVQSCPTLCDLMDCSPPGSSVHGICQARTGIRCHFFVQGSFPTQGSNPRLPRWWVYSLPLSYLGSPGITFNVIIFSLAPRCRIGTKLLRTTQPQPPELEVKPTMCFSNILHYLLGWQKSLLGFSQKMFQKNPKELFDQLSTIHIMLCPMGKMS